MLIWLSQLQRPESILLVSLQMSSWISFKTIKSKFRLKVQHKCWTKSKVQLMSNQRAHIDYNYPTKIIIKWPWLSIEINSTRSSVYCVRCVVMIKQISTTVLTYLNSWTSKWSCMRDYKKYLTVLYPFNHSGENWMRNRKRIINERWRFKVSDKLYESISQAWEILADFDMN